MEKIILTGLLPDEITESLGLEQKFRGRQIFRWIGAGAGNFDMMTNLSAELRTRLKDIALLRSSSVTGTLRDPDGTVKLQITLHDGNAVETVLLTDREGRRTACVSCQAGCAMGCAFCRTGTLGLARNLLPGEIVEQFLWLEQEAGRLDNIVFMGMGEPMQNLDGIRKAVRILTDRDGRALSARRITLSTCGIIKGIYDLAENGPSVRLAVSLTTADQKFREELMPIAKANPLPELKRAVRFFTEKTGRRVTLEAALMDGVNTDTDAAADMMEFAAGLDVNINLIPWNPVPGLPFREPSAGTTENFAERLRRAGLNVTLRTRRGRSIGGACGQLGRTEVNDNAQQQD